MQRVTPNNSTGTVRLSDKAEFRQEEQRLNRRMGIEKKPRETYYEKQLKKFGFMENKTCPSKD